MAEIGNSHIRRVLICFLIPRCLSIDHIDEVKWLADRFECSSIDLLPRIDLNWVDGSLILHLNILLRLFVISDSFILNWCVNLHLILILNKQINRHHFHLFTLLIQLLFNFIQFISKLFYFFLFNNLVNFNILCICCIINIVFKVAGLLCFRMENH